MSQTTGAGRELTIKGVPVPRLGFGTWELTGRQCAPAVRDALEIGYRHVDTAAAYGNEREVGEGLRAGGVPREEIFLTTKVWMEDVEPARLRNSAEGSLRALGTDYVDLLLIHWPNPDVPLASSLQELGRLCEEGKIRHLGVSNFPAGLLAEALELAPVFCNQVEYHPYLGQAALLALAREQDVMITAYAPLARGQVHDDPVLREIGETHGKSAAQVALRWLIDQPQVSAVPKAAGEKNRRANFDIFDFELADEERSRIDGLERGERLISPGFAPDWDA